MRSLFGFGTALILLGLIDKCGKADGQFKPPVQLCNILLSRGITAREMNMCKNGEYTNGGQYHKSLLVLKCICLNVLAAQGIITLAQGDSRIGMINTLGVVL